MLEKLDMENDKGEAAATLFEDCESDELTTDIVENNSGKDEERATCLPHQLHGRFQHCCWKENLLSEKYWLRPELN